MNSFWLSGSSAQWRVPIALQIVLALIMIVGISFVSPVVPPPFLSSRTDQARRSCLNLHDGLQSTGVTRKHLLSSPR